ncbi:four helix bundle protein [Candidatus Parcubacteria bacterium]|nr:four helix bundle protein [Candidatus Parcubacteria bacterium]
MKQNIIAEKSYKFALRIVKLSQYLVKNKKEFVLSKQILRSGTSIGANIEESIGGQSKKDFLNKVSIAYKETRETMYWLRILKDSDFITKDNFVSIYNDAEEIAKVISKIQKITKESINDTKT